MLDKQAVRKELARRELERRASSSTSSGPTNHFQATEQTERQIAERPSTIRSMREDPLSFFGNIGNPLTRMAAPVAAAGEALESIPANIGLGIQQRKPIREILSNVGQGMRGERPAQLGDIARASAVPGISSGPMPAILGMLGMATPVGKIAGKAVNTVAGKVGRAATAPLRADALTLGRPSTISKPNPIRDTLFEKARQRLLRAPKLAGQEFDQGLDDVVTTITKSGADPAKAIVDGSESIRIVQAARAKNPAFETLLKGASKNTDEYKLVQSVIDDPNLAANLTLPQSQTVKQVFQRALKPKFVQATPEYLESHLEMLDAWHSLRAAQLRTGGPEFAKLLEGYHTVMSHFRMLKPMLKEQSFETALLGDLGKKGAVIKAFRELATPDTLKLVERLQKATTTRSVLKRIGIWSGAATATTAIGAGAGMAFKAAMQK